MNYLHYLQTPRPDGTARCKSSCLKPSGKSPNWAHQPRKMQGFSGLVKETQIYLLDARLHELNKRLTEGPLGLSVWKAKQNNLRLSCQSLTWAWQPRKMQGSIRGSRETQTCLSDARLVELKQGIN